MLGHVPSSSTCASNTSPGTLCIKRKEHNSLAYKSLDSLFTLDKSTSNLSFMALFTAARTVFAKVRNSLVRGIQPCHSFFLASMCQKIPLPAADFQLTPATSTSPENTSEGTRWGPIKPPGRGEEEEEEEEEEDWTGTIGADAVAPGGEAAGFGFTDDAGDAVGFGFKLSKGLAIP